MLVRQPQSQKGAELIWKYPILLDACANEVQRQGDAMMSKWAEVSANVACLLVGFFLVMGEGSPPALAAPSPSAGGQTGRDQAC